MTMEAALCATPTLDAVVPAVRITPRFRRNRFKMFRAMLDELVDTHSVIRILDIGGGRGYWEDMRGLWDDLPLEITLANLDVEDSDDSPFLTRHASACDLSRYADNSFAVVHSNSVIEHVGHWPEMQAMAKEVRRLAPRYFVQTPNFWFPYEPHYRGLFMQFFPESVRAGMIVQKKRGFIGAATYHEAMKEVQEINLLTTRQMAELFPDAVIRHENIGPFTKSLIAIR